MLAACSDGGRAGAWCGGRVAWRGWSVGEWRGLSVGAWCAGRVARLVGGVGGARRPGLVSPCLALCLVALGVDLLLEVALGGARALPSPVVSCLLA